MNTLTKRIATVAAAGILTVTGTLLISHVFTMRVPPSAPSAGNGAHAAVHHTPHPSRLAASGADVEPTQGPPTPGPTPGSAGTGVRVAPGTAQTPPPPAPSPPPAPGSGGTGFRPPGGRPTRGFGPTAPKPGSVGDGVRVVPEDPQPVPTPPTSPATPGSAGSDVIVAPGATIGG